MEENKEPTSSIPVTEQAKKASSIYPEATRGALVSNVGDERDKNTGVSAPKRSNYTSIIVILIVGMAIGVLLGRTVFKAQPTVEEATKVLFGEVIDDLVE